MNGKIYIIINTKNGKRYIGITTRNVEVRIKEHFRCADKLNLPLHNDLKKYPKEVFESKILFENIPCKLQLLEMEKKLIEELKTQTPNGYNDAHKQGADHHMFMKEFSPETRAKINQARTGQKHSEATKRKIREKLRKIRRKPNAQTNVSGSTKMGLLAS